MYFDGHYVLFFFIWILDPYLTYSLLTKKNLIKKNKI